LRLQYLTRFSKPASDRVLYRSILHQPVRRILELGIGTGQRAVRMLELAGLDLSAGSIAYTGVDLFEARTAMNGPGITLKMAYRLLRSTGATIRLLPGDPFSALARCANELGCFDFVVISAWHDTQSLARSWFYLPRMLHANSRIFLEQGRSDAGEFREMSPADVQNLAGAATRRRAA
jgi:SAM-dependent methyltransferase